MSAPILVAGAGLGGLCAAISIVRAGRRVRVHEQAPALGEVGAGITLSSGTMRCLELLGVAAAVEAASDESTGVPFLHYRSGVELRRGLSSTAPRPAAARPARQIHRADLHAILVEHLRRLDPDSITLGRSCTGFTQDDDGVDLQFADGTSERGAALVGCDGIRSRLRTALTGAQQLTFTGQLAYRCLVPMDLARDILQRPGGAVYMGPGGTFNRYPLRHGTILNCVGLVRSDSWTDEGWFTPADRDEVRRTFADWHPEVRQLLEVAPPGQMIKWGLFVREPIQHWTQGRVTLLGDAAHPMLPFLGLGAAMAIEDAAVLGRALALDLPLQHCLQRYEAARRPRTRHIYDLSVQQGRYVQASDPENYAQQPAPAHDPTVFDFDPLAATL